jgi:AhpD family alkylhydroperoxidase
MFKEICVLNNWVEQLNNLRNSSGAFASANPAVMDAYRGLNNAQASGSALDAKTRELISLAVAITTRCDGCISSHAAAARKAGATEAEVSEALGTAIALNAGAAFVYSVRAMEAFGQFKE